MGYQFKKYSSKKADIRPITITKNGVYDATVSTPGGLGELEPGACYRFKETLDRSVLEQLCAMANDSGELFGAPLGQINTLNAIMKMGDEYVMMCDGNPLAVQYYATADIDTGSGVMIPEGWSIIVMLDGSTPTILPVSSKRTMITLPPLLDDTYVLGKENPYDIYKQLLDERYDVDNLYHFSSSNLSSDGFQMGSKNYFLINDFNPSLDEVEEGLYPYAFTPPDTELDLNNDLVLEGTVLIRGISNMELKRDIEGAVYLDVLSMIEPGGMLLLYVEDVSKMIIEGGEAQNGKWYVGTADGISGDLYFATTLPNAPGWEACEGYNTVTVDVQFKPRLQFKTATSNGTVIADDGYDGLSSVDVSVPDADDFIASIIDGTISGPCANDKVEIIKPYKFQFCESLTEVSFPACTTIGSFAFYNCSSLVSASFPSCTAVGSSAFDNCKSLVAASFPACMTVNHYAFRSCAALTSVDFPNCERTNQGAFTYCTALTSANFPACSYIYSNAFYGCRSLVSVDFPKCSSIGSNAFGQCSSMAEVSFPACTTIGYSAFDNCASLVSVSFPVCTTIGPYAFYSCKSLTSVDFPKCTSIATSAFYICSSLTEVSFPVCTTIGSSAFNGCASLTEASFPACGSIYNSAFYNCKSLTEVNFPNCTYIGSYAFRNCHSLTSVNLPNCRTIAVGAFGYCSSLTHISAPACSVIGGYVFQSCTSLASVDFPVCTNIGSLAFQSCSSLTEVSFPMCISIGSSAFAHCSSLSIAHFGKEAASKVTIYPSAFLSCINLTNLTLYHPVVATLSNINAFTSTPMSISTLTGTFGSIYVSASLVDAYKSTANWSVYADRITAIVEE